MSPSPAYDGLSSVNGKCVYWRERMLDEDRWDTSVPLNGKRLRLHCFMEGKGWLVTVGELPSECPDRWRCRYYVRTYY